MGQRCPFLSPAWLLLKLSRDRIISKDTHNAICLAVLVSMLVCPAGLRRKLEEYEKKAKYQIAEACTPRLEIKGNLGFNVSGSRFKLGPISTPSRVSLTGRGRVWAGNKPQIEAQRDNLTHWLISTQADTSGREHATYFCLQTKSHAHWDMSGSLQKMMQKLGCDVIDYRQWHPNDHFGLAHCAISAFLRCSYDSCPSHVHVSFSSSTTVNEMYVRDDHVRLPTAVDMSAEQNVKLRERIDAILDAIAEALHEDEHDGAGD